jgi:hypothetical protein
VSPNPEYQKEFQDAVAQSKKKAWLHQQQALQIQNDQVKEAKTQYSFMKRLVKSIRTNIQFEIKNFHIRYEDVYVSRKDVAFVFGISGESVNIAPCDEKYQKKYVDTAEQINMNAAYHLITLSNAGVYFEKRDKLTRIKCKRPANTGQFTT